MQTTYKQPGAPTTDPQVWIDDGGPDAETPARTQDRHRWPAGKLAEVELRWTAGTLEGMKLAGFALWEARTGNRLNVTMPARVYSVNGERRSFALLRTVDPAANEPHARVKALVLEAWEMHQERIHRTRPQQTHACTPAPVQPPQRLDAYQDQPAASLEDGERCPLCGKEYQRPNVNAADYRVDYTGNPSGHMCAACWRAYPQNPQNQDDPSRAPAQAAQTPAPRYNDIADGDTPAALETARPVPTRQEMAAPIVQAAVQPFPARPRRF